MPKAVTLYSLGPRKKLSEAANGAPRAIHTTSTLMGSEEDVSKLHAPSKALKLWRKATKKAGSMFIKEGSTVSVVNSQPDAPGSVTNERNYKSIGRVHLTATITDDLHAAYEHCTLPNMAFSVLGNPRGCYFYFSGLPHLTTGVCASLRAA